MLRAVAIGQAALELVDYDGQSELWAVLQVELGSALAQNPLGNRAENLEQAIHHLEQALEVYTRQAFPQQWAYTQNNLAAIYSDRIRGERTQNLEQAILRYRQVLKLTADCISSEPR
jgi:tetratricopeptide (TPR) repeat protein